MRPFLPSHKCSITLLRGLGMDVCRGVQRQDGEARRRQNSLQRLSYGSNLASSVAHPPPWMNTMIGNRFVFGFCLKSSGRYSLPCSRRLLWSLGWSRHTTTTILFAHYVFGKALLLWRIFHNHIVPFAIRHRLFSSHGIPKLRILTCSRHIPSQRTSTAKGRISKSSAKTSAFLGKVHDWFQIIWSSLQNLPYFRSYEEWKKKSLFYWLSKQNKTFEIRSQSSY